MGKRAIVLHHWYPPKAVPPGTADTPSGACGRDGRERMQQASEKTGWVSDEMQLAFTDKLGDRVNFTRQVPGSDADTADVYKITLDRKLNSEPDFSTSISTPTPPPY